MVALQCKRKYKNRPSLLRERESLSIHLGVGFIEDKEQEQCSIVIYTTVQEATRYKDFKKRVWIWRAESYQEVEIVH